MNRILTVTLVVLLMLGALPAPSGLAATDTSTRYLVVFTGTQSLDGTFLMDHTAALTLISSTGGTVTSDLSRQIGVMVVESSNALFLQTVRASGLVETASEDYSWKAFASYEEAVASGQLTVVDPQSIPGGGPEQTADPLETLQWDMQQINAPSAHNVQAGSRLVDVGVLDSGIDGNHVDFKDANGVSNVDCARGRNFVPSGPSPLGTPDPCIDNQFHGTHVAGTIGAQANGLGIVGVAPNVTLVPVKVCDSAGYCYSSSVVDGITYAGDAKLDVINMSFFVDDDQLLSSTEFKCASDDVQRTIRHAVERAIQYARTQGVTPVAALGNSDQDLAHPPDPYQNNCEVVPAETQGVIGAMALGRQSEKAPYSNYGYGMTDVAAPGGNGSTGDCSKTILSTIPEGTGYACIQGTSMASPHAAGVAALIISQFGRLGSDAGEPDVVMRPTEVESYLQSTTVDIGLAGYDECFGNGRIDALRAVTHDTSALYQPSTCPEYSE